jgi:hypothetical protein
MSAHAPYAILLSLNASRALAELPADLQRAITHKLEELAADGPALREAPEGRHRVVVSGVFVHYRVEHAHGRIILMSADDPPPR